jgi:hypothetical protein
MASTNPRLARYTRGLHRRVFLQAIAAGLTVPAAIRISRMATAQATPAPKRFFLFYLPHGVPPEHYDPRFMPSDRTSFALDQTNQSILAPLQPYRQYVNIYQGFQYKGEAKTHEGSVNVLSGIEAYDTNTPRTTLEHVIAKALNVKPTILGACSHLPYGLDRNGMMFWDGTPVDPQKSPVKAADTLFGNLGGGMAPPANADVQLRNDLMALTISEVQEMQTMLGSLTTERNKLQTQLDSLMAVKADLGGGTPRPSTCSTRPALPTVEMVRTASAGNVVDPSGGNDYFYQEKNFPLLLQAQLEVVAQALICNVAPVIALMPMYPTCDFDFGFMGVPGAHHNGISHTGPQAKPTAQYNSPITIDNLQPEARVGFAKTQRWFVQHLVTKVVSLLATTDDPAAPGTKVLDNTLIYFMSEIGDGQMHTRLSLVQHPQVPMNLPLMTIGKAGGAIKSGQVVTFPIDVADKAAAVNRPATDLYLTIARAMGASNATFPGTTGPVTEVLA